MIIKYCFLKKDQVEKILKTFSQKYGVPTVSLQIGVFLKEKNDVTLAIKTKGEKWTVEMSHKDKNLDKERFYMLNYNSKSFMNFLKMMGLENGTIGFRETYTFAKQGEYKLEITYDDFIGWSLRVESSEEKFIKIVKRILNKWGYTLLDEDTRHEMLKTEKNEEVEKSPLFNHNIKVLNQNFIEKCQILGLNYSRDPNTVLDLLESKTNDYTYLDQLYSRIIGSRLTSERKIPKAYKIPPVSIVICSHNSDTTIGHTLLSINSQDLYPEERERLEIIVVDDCSEKRVKDSIERYQKDLEGLNIQIIRLERNVGLQRARDIGLMSAQNDIVLFLDSDILLPQNYIREMVIRSSIIPNAAFVSFKKNIQPKDKINTLAEIKKGLRLPETIDDWRVQTYIKKGKRGHTIAKTSRCLDILEDSNYFKNLGFGKIHGIYSIDSMLVGHNYILRKSKVLKDRLAVECKFSGWGLEDSYVGTVLVANGGFIIPVISTSVYHIDHPPRSGSEEKKREELEKNLKRYREFLNKPFI